MEYPLDGSSLPNPHNHVRALNCYQPQVHSIEPLASLDTAQFALDFGHVRARLSQVSNTQVLKEPVSMEWTTPRHEEIDLNCEVSSYANAEL